MPSPLLIACSCVTLYITLLYAQKKPVSPHCQQIKSSIFSILKQLNLTSFPNPTSHRLGCYDPGKIKHHPCSELAPRDSLCGTACMSSPPPQVPSHRIVPLSSPPAFWRQRKPQATQSSLPSSPKWMPHFLRVTFCFVLQLLVSYICLFHCVKRFY